MLRVVSSRSSTPLLTRTVKNKSQVFNRIRRSPGSHSILINSISFHVFCGRYFRVLDHAGAHFESFLSSLGEVALTVASFARSLAFSVTRSASAQTRVL